MKSSMLSLSRCLTAAIATTTALLVGCATSHVSEGQLDSVRKAAQSVLPSGATVEVEAKKHTFSKPDIVISAHLLEGHSADETNPYVQGDYGTHEKLARLVRFRCVKVFRAIASQTELPEASSFIIQARHGVRVTTSYGGALGSTENEALTIYTVRISFPVLKKVKDPDTSDDEIMNEWTVEYNIIPTLEFVASPF